MRAAVQSRVVSDFVVRFVMMAGLSLAALCAMALTAHGDEGTSGIETGSIKRDAVVAPVRRVFPKTPSDRDLNRLTSSTKAKSKKRRTAKKR